MRARWLRLAAYVVVVLAGAAGFYRVEQVQRESCERGNEFRSEDLPAAFAAYTRALGDELDADPEQVDRVVARSDELLAETFPLRDC